MAITYKILPIDASPEMDDCTANPEASTQAVRRLGFGAMPII